MAAAIKIHVLAIKFVDKKFVIDTDVTPRQKTFRAQGLTKATISKSLGKEVLQLYEDGDEEGDYCCIDESVLSSLDAGTMVYAQLAEEEASSESDEKQDSSTWFQQDLLAAHLCAAMYEEDPVLHISQINQAQKLERIDFFDVSCHGDVKFMIADVGFQRFVAVKGTISCSDWQKNFNLLPGPSVPICGGKLHQGFAQYSEFFPKDAISSWVQDGSDKKQVIVAGHSLGGALASIVALRGLMSPSLAKKEALRAVTFGAPFYATSEVCKFIDSKGWKKYFHNYVAKNDPVPSLLNVHPQHSFFAVLDAALSKQSLQDIDERASEIVKVKPNPQYSPLGDFIELYWDNGICLRTGPLKEDAVTKRLGKHELPVKCREHCMTSGYLHYLLELQSTMSTMKGVKEMKEAIGRRMQEAWRNPFGANSSMPHCIGRNKMTKLLVGRNYEYEIKEGEYVFCKIQSVNADGTYSGICLGSNDELTRIVSAKAREAKLAPCTLNVLMSTRTVDGMPIPTNVLITSEVTDAKHIATSLLWLCDLSIEGLTFRTTNGVPHKTLRINGPDSEGKLRLHFHGDFTMESAQVWQVSEQPFEVTVTHRFLKQPVKFTTKSSDYKLHVEKPLGALSPLEDILDAQTTLLLIDAFQRLVMEVFLGEAAALPPKSRVEKMQSIPLFQYFVTLEMLSTGGNSQIQRFMAETLFEELPSRQSDDYTETLRKLLHEKMPQELRDVLLRIARFVFGPHKLSFTRGTTEKICHGVGLVVLAGGIIVFAGAAAPVIYYGGFAAASAALEVGLGATCAYGAAGVGAGGVGMWLGSEPEKVNDNYKQVLVSFIEQLGGRSAEVQEKCLSLEEKIEQLVLASELMKNDVVKQRLFRERKFSTDPNARNCLTSRSFGRIWKPCQQRLSFCNASPSSKDLISRHLFATQVVRSIRSELLDTCYVAVVGMQNAGKSSFLKHVWPHCQVEGLGGGSNHTVVAKPHRINNEVVVVDFPGINDWADVRWQSNMFMGMATFAVVILKCESVAQEEGFFLEKVLEKFKPEQILVFANQADRCPDQIQDSSAAERLRREYATKERLNFNHEQIFLTAMVAVDDEGQPSEEKMRRCVAKGIKGPTEVREQLQESLFKLLRKHVSLDAPLVAA